MKIVTWNINGIRSLKKSMGTILKELDGDVVCFQETKISRSLLPEDVAVVDGYTSYFSFSKKRTGYSGVATYCRDSYTPVEAEEGLSGTLKSNKCCIGSLDNLKDMTFPVCIDLGSLDSEGRAVITQHEIQYQGKAEKLVVFNVYCPCVDPEKPERKEFKMQYMKLLESRAISLLKEGYHVVIVGDLNIAHQPIDHCDPGDEKEFSTHEARQWLTSFLTRSFTENGDCETLEGFPSFVDVFRNCHPQRKEAYTCWNTLTGARQTNYGTRIDYILMSHKLLPIISSCEILHDVFGSDHCPVSANLSCSSTARDRLPSMCTRLWPEFAGQQQKLISFLQKSSTPIKSQEIINKTTKRKESEKIHSQHKKNKPTDNVDQQKTITSFFIGRTNPLDRNKVSNAVNKNGSICKLESKTDDTSNEIIANNEDYNCMENTDVKSEVMDELSSNTSKTKQAMLWKTVLKGLPPPPLCNGHGKVCVLRTVKKEGPNFNRQFYACPQPNGHASNPETRCSYFKWATPAKRSVLKSTLS